MNHRKPAELVLIGILALALVGCGHSVVVSQVRFKNQPVTWQVNDRREVKAMPREVETYDLLYFADRTAFIRIKRALKPKAHIRALDVNAVGEVPDSTWFSNRIGRRALSPADIARGPNHGDGPILPLTVKKSKRGGKATGFIATDAGGTTYIVKFDSVEAPLIETSTDVIVQRLLWAAGYNVPENFVLNVKAREILLTDASTIKDAQGRKRTMTQADLNTVLASVDARPNGTYRVLASKYLPGRPLGGFLDHGVRKDDPNDRIPHQHRRSLRGLYVFFSWLGYTDVKAANTLDIWIEDPNFPGKHYVVHYLLDFGKSFGAFTTAEHVPSDGHAYAIDYKIALLSLVTLGMWKRPWEGTVNPGISGVASFDAEHFHPGKWKPHWPWVIFLEKDRFDMFWAAKIVTRFTPDLIRAAVKEGNFEDPAAVDYLTDVLVKRARKVARYWFAKVNPLDEFVVSGNATSGYKLCFRDLWTENRLGPETATVYRLQSFDFGGRSLGFATRSRQPCLSGFTADNRDGYLIARIETVRGNQVSPSVEVHLARDPVRGALRIVGLNRR